MRSQRGVLLVAAAVLAMVGVGACGSDDASGNAQAGMADRSDPKLAPVKVGQIGAIGTPTNNFPSAPAALAAGIRALNARGGLNGHRVEMVFCNDRSDPNQTAVCAQRMVDAKVVAIAGGSSVFGSQAQPILAKAGIPMVGIAPVEPQLFNAKNVYVPAVSTGTAVYEAAIAYAAKNDLLPMAVAVSDNPAGKAYTDQLEATLKKVTSGQGWAAEAPVANDTADYAPIAGALDAAKPKSLVLAISAQQQQGLMAALHSRGSQIAAYLAGPNLSLEQIKDRPLGNRLITAQGLPAFNDSSMERFRNELEAEEAAGNEDASLDKMYPISFQAWLALQAVEQVTKGQDTITAQSVTEALDDAKDIDLGGIIPPWTPSTPGPEGLSRVSNTSLYFAGFDNGQAVSLMDAPVALKEILAGHFEARLPEAVQQVAN